MTMFPGEPHENSGREWWPNATGMRGLARISSDTEREPAIFDDFRLADVRTPRTLKEIKPLPLVYWDEPHPVTIIRRALWSLAIIGVLLLALWVHARMVV